MVRMDYSVASPTCSRQFRQWVLECGAAGHVSRRRDRCKEHASGPADTSVVRMGRPSVANTTTSSAARPNDSDVISGLLKNGHRNLFPQPAKSDRMNAGNRTFRSHYPDRPTFPVSWEKGAPSGEQGEMTGKLAEHEQYLKAGEAAVLLHVSPKTISRWAKEGRIPHLVTLGGHRRFPRTEIEALVSRLSED